MPLYALRILILILATTFVEVHMIVLGTIALTHVGLLQGLTMSIHFSICHFSIVVCVCVCISTILIDAVILAKVVPRIGEARIILHIVGVLATDVR